MRKKITVILSLVLAMGMVLIAGCGKDNNRSTGESSSKVEDVGTVKISLDEWIGWQSLLDANGGLKTAPDSINAKNGISVEYKVINDGSASSSALISGELDGAGYTVNRYAFLQDKFDSAGVSVVMPFITNFSNGGDGIIATQDIHSVSDLVGKRVGVPRYSEAQTLVEWLLNNSSLTSEEQAQIRKDMVFFETPDEAAEAFFAGKVDAAATWEPYLTDAATSTDSRVLFDTSMSTNLILDGIVFNKEFVDEHGEWIELWISGALEAAPMYKKEFNNIRQMPMFELMSDDEIIEMAEGADLATCSQNVKLLSDSAVQMYADMAQVWITIGERAYPEKAQEAFNDKFVRSLLEQYPDEGSGEKEFSDDEKTKILESPEALLSYRSDIKFDLNSSVIKDESKAELDSFVEVAKILDGVYIQIEGNTAVRADGVTDEEIIAFSKDRAQAVADYFIESGIDAERFIIVGNGDSNYLDPENPASPVNRRTEIYFKPKAGF
ncbi:MAG: OmpA family protein [Clostridia bacterium]|nr:OmpA family protein [Clostridia bacterium]